jgi:hypothetical protein
LLREGGFETGEGRVEHSAAAPGADPITPPANGPSAAAEVTLNDEEKRMAKSMNISEADMLATKRAHLAA